MINISKHTSFWLILNLGLYIFVQGTESMKGLSNTSWSKVNDFLLNVLSVCDIDEFFSKVLDSLPSLIPFENSGCLIEVNKSRPQIIKSIQSEERWNDCFNEYYYKVATPPTYEESIYAASPDELQKINIDEYVNDFLNPQNIKCSTGLVLFNQKNEPAYTFVINRSGSEAMFSEEELAVVDIIQPHVFNHYRMVSQMEKLHRLPVLQLELEEKTRMVSERESEIINLLLLRLKPADIAKELKISVATVRRHLHNIYYKLHVAGRQQLLEKIKSETNSQSNPSN